MMTTRGAMMVGLLLALTGCDDTQAPADMGMQNDTGALDATSGCPSLGTPTVTVVQRSGADCGDVSDAELLSMLSETSLECAVRDVSQDATCAITFETECDAGAEGDVWEWRGTLTHDGEEWSGRVARRTLTGGVLCASEYYLTAR